MNVQDVISAIKYADAQGEISNYMGYLVRCIQNRYFEKEAVSVVEGSMEKAETIREFRESAHSEETKKKVWESIKAKDNFEAFRKYEELAKGITFMELDEILSPAEAVAEYIAWRTAGEPLE
jgi:hypothetical protein